MGSSYQTALVAGELASIQDALAEAGVPAIVAPVRDGWWAVIAQEDEGGYADSDGVAELMSRKLGGLAASFQVHDSDALTVQLFRAGKQYHRYLSDQSILMQYWDDSDNEIWINLNGDEWTGEGLPPATATGGDPEAFAGFGAETIDLARLQVALSAKETFAEQQHCAILTALGLNPRPLTEAFRHTKVEDLPGAVLVSPRAA